MARILILALMGAIIFGFLGWGVHCKAMCVNFGRIGCGKEKIYITNVTYYSQGECVGNSGVLSTCGRKDDLTLLQKECDNKKQCEFPVLSCNTSSGFKQFGLIKYSCKNSKPSQGKRLCVRFGRMVCNSSVIKLSSVMYFSKRWCRNETQTVQTCKKDTNGISLDFLERACNNHSLCDFEISRCLDNKKIYRSANIEYQCANDKPETTTSVTEKFVTTASVTVKPTTTISPSVMPNFSRPASTETTDRGEYKYSTTEEFISTFVFSEKETTTKDGTTYWNTPEDTAQTTDAENGEPDTTTLYKHAATEPLFDKGASVGPVIGGVVGGLFLIVILIVAVIVWCRCRKRLNCFAKEFRHKSLIRRKSRKNSYQEHVNIYDIARNSTNSIDKSHENGSQNNNRVSVTNEYSMEVVPSADSRPSSTVYSLAKDPSLHQELQHKCVEPEDGNAGNYFVLERDYETQPQGATTHITDQTTASKNNGEVVSPKSSADDYSYAELAANEYAKPYHVVKADSFQNGEVIQNHQGEANNSIARDKYGYSHMADLKRVAANRDMTYDHVTSDTNNEDHYGYAHASDNPGPRVQPTAHHKGKPARTIDSDYAMCSNNNDAPYDTLVNR